MGVPPLLMHVRLWRVDGRGARQCHAAAAAAARSSSMIPRRRCASQVLHVSACRPLWPPCASLLSPPPPGTSQRSPVGADVVPVVAGHRPKVSVGGGHGRRAHQWRAPAQAGQAGELHRGVVWGRRRRGPDRRHGASCARGARRRLSTTHRSAMGVQRRDGRQRVHVAGPDGTGIGVPRPFHARLAGSACDA